MKRDLIDFDEVFGDFDELSGDLVQEKLAAKDRGRPTYRQGLDTAFFGALALAYWFGALWFACATFLV